MSQAANPTVFAPGGSFAKTLAGPSGQVDRRLAALIDTGSDLETVSPVDTSMFRKACDQLAAGQAVAALVGFGTVLHASPTFSPAWMMVEACCAMLDLPNAAVAAARRAVRHDPDLAVARSRLVRALQQAGDIVAAIQACLDALQRAPSADLWSTLGRMLHNTRRFAEAAAAHQAAASLQPDPQPRAECLLASGNAWQAADQMPQAAAAYGAAIETWPVHAVAHCNLGMVLHEAGAFDAALVACRAAVALRADLPAAHHNLGTVLHTFGRFDEAAAAYATALQLAPDDAETWNQLGALATETGTLPAAEAAFAHALRHRPDCPRIRYNRSLALLRGGRMPEGWVEHEWRWQGMLPPHGLTCPQWRGEALAGRSILLHAEQGLGDTLQFARYAPLVARLGGRVVLEVQPPLVRLLRGLGVPVIATGNPRPVTDWHCPLLSLPTAFGTTLDSIPAAPGYLTAEPASVTAWEQRLPAGDKPRIGLVWAGSPRPAEARSNATDRRRSITLAQFAPLAGAIDAHWISLQLGAGAAQAASPPPGLALIDMTDRIGDFADTAGLIATLDLVIVVDTSVAHLAGALGRPVWLLSRFDGCWRWLQDGQTTPWYASMRLFRQTVPGNWDSVVARVAEALSKDFVPELRRTAPTAIQKG